MALVRRGLVIALQSAVVGALLGSAVAWADLVTGGPAQGGTGAQGAKKTELELAQEAFTSGNFAGALDQLKKAVEKNKDLSPPHVIMARLYANVSNVNLGAMARNSLEAAVAEDPKDPEAYVVLAGLALGDRRWTEADLLLSKAAEALDVFKGSEVRRKGLEPQILSGHAAVCEAREQWAAAQKSLEKLLVLDNKNVSVLQRLARVLFLQDNFAGAVKQLQDAAKLDPNALNPHAQLALFFQASRKPGSAEKAKNEMSLAIKEDGSLRTYLAAASWAIDAGEIEEAERFATKALEDNKGSLDAKMLLGSIAYVRKQYEKAENYFQQVLNEVPASLPAANNLALALCEQSDSTGAKKSRAVQHALTVAQRAPKSAEAQSTLGWACFKADQKQQAVASMQQAVQLGQLSRDAAYFAAAVFADVAGTNQDVKNAARQLLEQALNAQQGPFSRAEEARALAEKLKK